MRRLIAILVLLVLIIGTTAVRPTPASLTHAARLPIPVEYLGSERPDNIPFSVNATADECKDAPELTLPGGDESQVFFFSEAATDPLLSCTWGTPPAPQGKKGYRTAWYKFQPGRSGVVTIETLGSTYDTILAVHTGSCTESIVDLTMIACNDDYLGFDSRLTVTVRRGTTYYVEVADWQKDPPADPRVQLAIWLEPIDSGWEPQGFMPLPRSRHMMLGAGQDLYVLGGVEGFGFPLDLTNDVQRYNTATGDWTPLSSLPVADGVANTSAVFLNGKIYIPGGFTGNVNTYNNTHWVYDPATDFWSTAASPVWPNSAPLAWATAVVPKTAAIPPGYFLIGGTSDVPPFDPPYTTAIAQPSSEVLYYFLDRNEWDSTSFPELQTARFGHTAAWVGGKLCVVGGLIAGSSSNEILAGGECYLTGSWQPIAGLNVSRYAADSAIGPDGRWYVFGGVTSVEDEDGDPISIAVESTEVYDPAADTWTLLTSAFDLGDFETSPPRAWPQGVFVGDTLWAMGGNEINATSDIVPLVESLKLYVYPLWLPFTVRDGSGAAPPPNNTFATAYGLPLNTPQNHTFAGILDLYDVFYFDLPDTRTVKVKLESIPEGSDYGLALYSANKLPLGESNNPGAQDESIQRTLTAGRYYFIVERVFPQGPPDTNSHRVVVEG